MIKHRPLAMLTMICGIASSQAFGADELQAKAKQSAGQDPLFLTATNGPSNYLAVVNTRTKEVDYVATGGAGGVSGNAGGVAIQDKLAAVINFGSSNVTIFVRQGNSIQATQTLKITSQPVSLAFGHGHLIVLGQTTAESFPVYGTMVGPNDGIVPLLKGDKTAGQITTYDGGAAYTEESGDIGLLSLSTLGAPGLSGTSVPVTLPAAPNNDTPFGIVGQGANLYVAIAHSNLQALIVKGQIISTAGGPTPFKNSSGGLLHAPCWNALAGHFLYSADSPGQQLLRYLVSDNNVFFDKSTVAQLTGSPTDLAVQGNLLGVIDGGDGVNFSNVSLFDIDSEGELTLRSSMRIPSRINGAAIMQ